jgi:hypothetical protein
MLAQADKQSSRALYNNQLMELSNELFQGLTSLQIL